jgi:pyridoxal/pyridoxine/pyridoxamine kinase
MNSVFPLQLLGFEVTLGICAHFSNHHTDMPKDLAKDILKGENNLLF